MNLRDRQKPRVCYQRSLVSPQRTTPSPYTPAQVITLDDAIGIALERNVPTSSGPRTTEQLNDVAVRRGENYSFLPNLLITTTGNEKLRSILQLGRRGSYINETTNSLTPGSVPPAVTFVFGVYTMWPRCARRSLPVRRAKLDLSRAPGDRRSSRAGCRIFLSLILQPGPVTGAAGESGRRSDARRADSPVCHFPGTRASADLYQQQANVASCAIECNSGGGNATELGKVDLLRTLQLDPIQNL